MLLEELAINIKDGNGVSEIKDVQYASTKLDQTRESRWRSSASPQHSYGIEVQHCYLLTSLKVAVAEKALVAPTKLAKVAYWRRMVLNVALANMI